jgi:uncharacterized protein (DUF305 family)
MNRFTITLAAAVLIGSSAAVLAQEEHEQHHPEGTQTEAEAAPAQPSGGMQMMENMPEQCRAMMQTMPQECMSAMQQMMPGMIGQGGMMQGGTGQTTSDTGASGASQAYQQAIDRMHSPMAEAIKIEDPDVAFVRGMIPHHQSAIDMAKVVQQYGKDAQTQKWAAEIIAAQEREIAEMREWLEKNAK